MIKHCHFGTGRWWSTNINHQKNRITLYVNQDESSQQETPPTPRVWVACLLPRQECGCATSSAQGWFVLEPGGPGGLQLTWLSKRRSWEAKKTWVLPLSLSIAFRPMSSREVLCEKILPLLHFWHTRSCCWFHPEKLKAEELVEEYTDMFASHIPSIVRMNP